MKKLLLIALLLITGSTMTAQKQNTVIGDNEGWNKIGTSTLDLKSQTEEIIITDADKLKAIKLYVSEAPIFLESFDVHFADGSKQTVEYGGYDPVILNGNGRKVVTKVTLRYKSIDDMDKKARVELLAVKTHPDRNDIKLASK